MAYYPPGSVTPIPAGLPAPHRSVVKHVGAHQMDILIRCRQSAGWGTLIRRDTVRIRESELQAARALADAGMIELREFGSPMLGRLWAVLLTKRGRDCWLGYVGNRHVKIDTLQSSL